MRGVSYVQRVSQVRDLARRYWFDVLVAVLAIVAMLEVVLGHGSPGAPQTTLWFSVLAIAILVLAVFARRRFPFAGPAVYWLLAGGISFVDPLLIPYADALFPIGMADAFLLGNLRDVRRAVLGLAVVVGGAATIVANIPGHPASQLVVVPLEFAISWVAGFAYASGPCRPRRPSHARLRPSWSGTPRPGSRWPRNVPGSRANCTTSSPTPSA